MGLVIGALALQTPEFMDAIKAITERHFPEEFAATGIKADLMMHQFWDTLTF